MRGVCLTDMLKRCVLPVLSIWSLLLVFAGCASEGSTFTDKAIVTPTPTETLAPTAAPMQTPATAVPAASPTPMSSPPRPAPTPRLAMTAEPTPIPTWDESLFGVWVVESPFFIASQTAPQLRFELAKWELSEDIPHHQTLVHKAIDKCHIYQTIPFGTGEPGWTMEHDSFDGGSRTWASYQGELFFVAYCMKRNALDVCFDVGCHIEDENERETCRQDAEVVLRTLQAVPNPYFTPVP